MKQFCLLGCALVLGGASLFAADPQLLNMSIPNAQMYAGMNVEQAKTSQFAQFLLSNMPVGGEFETFITSTGFDPRRDLSEILVTTAGTATPSVPGKHSGMTGLFLAKGTFNLSQIMSAAAKDQKITVSTYAGAQLLSIAEGDQAHAVAFPDASTAVAGDLASVKGALDRRSGTNVIAAALMARINLLSTTEDAWSVSTANFGAFVPMPGGSGGAGSAVLQGIQQASGGVKFGASVQVSAQAVTKDSGDASSLGDVIKLLAQMVQMHGGTNGAPEQVTDLLKSLVVSTDGNVVNVSLSLPEDQLETLFKMAESQKDSVEKI